MSPCSWWSGLHSDFWPKYSSQVLLLSILRSSISSHFTVFDDHRISLSLTLDSFQPCLTEHDWNQWRASHHSNTPIIIDVSSMLRCYWEIHWSYPHSSSRWRLETGKTAQLNNWRELLSLISRVLNLNLSFGHLVEKRELC